MTDELSAKRHIKPGQTIHLRPGDKLVIASASADKQSVAPAKS